MWNQNRTEIVIIVLVLAFCQSFGRHLRQGNYSIGNVTRQSGGLTGDSCSTAQDNCVSPRQCWDIGDTSNIVACTSSSTSCICSSESLTSCTSSSVCVSGERCVQSSTNNTFCASCEAAASTDGFTIVDDGETCVVDNGEGGDDDDNTSDNDGENEDGLSGDPCSYSSDICKSPRVCVDGNFESTSDICTSSSDGCFCVPEEFTECTSSSDCVSGERCVKGSSSQTYCISCKLAAQSTVFTNVDDGETCDSGGDGASGDNDDNENGEDGGTNEEDENNDPGESDEEDENDGSDENDEEDENDDSDENDEDDENDDSDENDEDDENNDSDENDEDDSDNPPFGGDNSSSSDDSNGNSGSVCVAVKHLKHLSSSELVFPQHRRAAVLCDASESCATPGHIVVYQARAMTMSRYCSAVAGGCVRKVGVVNSPRMRRGLRVGSFSHGLQFTSLAARYESLPEEIALRLLVRLGL